MISITKYLNRANAENASQGEPEAVQSGWKFSKSVLDCVARHVLNGKGQEALRAELLALKDSIDPAWTEEDTGNAEKKITRILADHAVGTRQSTFNQAVEIQHIFATLNQALVAMTDGKDESVSRLNQIQQLLERTSKIQDGLALKSSLLEAVEFVKTESVRASESASREIGIFETEVSQAREFLADTKEVFAGRPEAVARIAEHLGDTDGKNRLRVVAYSLSRLPAIANRYGPAIAGELVYRLIRERIQPFAGAEPTYRWTPSALVAIFPDGDIEMVRTQVNTLNRSPLVHKVTLGNRTAVLTITPAHLVAEGAAGDHETLIEHVDRFAGLTK